MDATSKVLDALSIYADAFTEYARTRAEQDARLERLKTDWRRRLESAVQEEVDAYVVSRDDAEEEERDSLFQGIEEALTNFWNDGNPEVLGPWPVLEEAATSELHGMAAPRRDVARLLQEAKRPLTQPFTVVVSRLEAWLEEVRSGQVEAEDWAPILRRWRQGLDITTREAAHVLDTSAGAIVRWEKAGRDGGRTPRLSTLTEAVTALIAAGPVPPESDEHTKLRHAHAFLAASGIEFSEDPQQMLDAPTLEAVDLQDRVSVALMDFDIHRLRAVAALVEDPIALDALLAWASKFDKHPLEPVAAALLARGVDSDKGAGHE